MRHRRAAARPGRPTGSLVSYLVAWEKAGNPPEQQDRLIDWLAAAIEASSKDSISPLPPETQVVVDLALVSEQLVRQLTQPPAAKPRAKAGGDQTGRAPPAGRRFPARSGVAGPWAAAAAGPRSATSDRPGQAAVRGGRGPARPRTSRGCRCRWSRRRPSCRLCAACRHPRPGVPVSPAASDPQELTTPPAPAASSRTVVDVGREARTAAESSAEAAASRPPQRKTASDGSGQARAPSTLVGLPSRRTSMRKSTSRNSARGSRASTSACGTWRPN